MFKLPSDFEKNDFVGKFLAEIGLGIGTISLNFRKASQLGPDSESFVTLHADFSCCVVGAEQSCLASEPVTASVLTAFLNADVTDFTVDDRFAFRICFGQLGEVRGPQHPDGFESFAILIPGKAEIVGP